MNKTSKLSAATCLLLASTGGTVLAADVAGNVAFTNDYRFRGIAQSGEQAFAVSGGFDVETEDGFYAGLWASSVDFQIQAANDADTELDIYAGYGAETEDGLSYSFGFLHYAYPSAAGSLNYDFTEITGSLGFENFSLDVAYTSDYFAGSGSASYIALGYGFDLEDDMGSVSFSIGSQSVDDNAAWGTPDWMDYKIAYGTSFSSLDFEIAYVDTDLSEAECFGGSDWCDATVVLTLSKSL